jgi:alpha-tubulin suppressor-like RCC1 family protein
MGEPFVRSFIEIPLGLEMDENVKQLESGKSHNLLLTSKGRLIFFGATLHGQLGRKISKNST